MESPIAEEHDSGSICEGISNSSIPKYMDSDMMERIYSCLCDKRTSLRNSAKLKSQIHSEINDLVEILRERERHLFLEIDEINLDQCEAVRIIAELCNYANSESSGANSPVIKQSTSDDEESPRMHSTTFMNSEMEFVSNFNDVKALLQNFGHIKKMEHASESSDEDAFENVLDEQPTDEQVNDSLCRGDSSDTLTDCFDKSKAERSRKDSSGSADSFEVIDPCGEEFQQFTEEHKQKDGMEQASDSPTSNTTVTDNQVLPVSDVPAAATEPQQRYKLKTHWMIDSKRLREVLNHKKKKKSKSSSKPLWPPADCRILPPLDPTKRLRKQLKEMAVSKKPSHNVANLEACADHNKEKPEDVKGQETKIQSVTNAEIASSLGNQSSPVKIESNKCLPKAKPVPSAIIQETFKKFLVLNTPDKWLASPKKCFQPAIKSDSHVFNAKRLHFQVQ